VFVPTSPRPKRPFLPIKRIKAHFKRKIAPFFSTTSTIPNFQVLSFDIDTHIPGVGGSMSLSSQEGLVLVLSPLELALTRNTPASLPISDELPQSAANNPLRINCYFAKSFEAHSYEKRLPKSFRIHSYEMGGFKVPSNHTLTKKGWGVPPLRGIGFQPAPKTPNRSAKHARRRIAHSSTGPNHKSQITGHQVCPQGQRYAMFSVRKKPGRVRFPFWLRARTICPSRSLPVLPAAGASHRKRPRLGSVSDCLASALRFGRLPGALAASAWRWRSAEPRRFAATGKTGRFSVVKK
jgi:hypothetical protein